ncbi:DNA ligase 1 isoform X6 [Gossypium hirsutum]|uniref:DNA ligase 1 isoform X6 n=1 Tax=Gossypium hirsutum TaxID=3635 RepID=A0A1U8NK51_GOSHI|nr:DNA ligase 1 isoform X6 [Gossypium hirsutum]
MQILSTRARKNVLLSDIKVDVCIFAFDILYLNGQALLQEQLEIRKEIGDTLDLLPVAAFHGKRTGVCGSFLLACYDDNNEEYQGICKIGIGFTEAVCEECSASLRSKVIPEPKHSYYHYTGEMPDVWFEAAERTTLFS